MERSDAEERFNEFAEGWDIDTDIEDLNEDEQKSFNDLKKKLVRAFENERLALNEDGSLTQRLKYSELANGLKELTFNRPKGSAYLSSDRFKDREGQKKVFSFLADMSKQPIQNFSAMDSADIKISHAIVTLFLAS